MEAAYLQGSFTALCDLPALEVLNLRVNRLVFPCKFSLSHEARAREPPIPRCGLYCERHRPVPQHQRLHPALPWVSFGAAEPVRATCSLAHAPATRGYIQAKGASLSEASAEPPEPRRVLEDNDLSGSLPAQLAALSKLEARALRRPALPPA